MPDIVFCTASDAEGEIIAKVHTNQIYKSEAVAFQNTIESLIKNLDPHSNTHSFNSDDNEYTYHTYRSEDWLYIAITEIAVKIRTAYSYLKDVAAQNEEKEFKPKDLKKYMRKKLTFYNDPDNDKISKIDSQIERTKDVVRSNMEKVLERGERLDNIDDKAVEIKMTANVFKKKAIVLKRTMLGKYIILIIAAVILIIAILAILATVAGVLIFIVVKFIGEKLRGWGIINSIVAELPNILLRMPSPSLLIGRALRGF